MLKQIVTLLTGSTLLLAGCHWGCTVKRESELNCPTDIRKTIPWCAGEDAIFHCPCQTSCVYHGHKPTCWSSWPSSGAQWRDSYCGCKVPMEDYPTLESEEVPAPAEMSEATVVPIARPSKWEVGRPPVFPPPSHGSGQALPTPDRPEPRAQLELEPPASAVPLDRTSQNRTFQRAPAIQTADYDQVAQGPTCQLTNYCEGKGYLLRCEHEASFIR